MDINSQLEAVGVELEIKGNRHRFIAVYVPPNVQVSEEDFEGLFRVSRTIVGGDLNAKSTSWGCRISNVRGKMLEKLGGLEV